jgi:hypothetical protein
MGIKLGTSHRFFRNRVLRKTFKPDNKKVIGEWMRLHNGEPHYYYYLPDIRKSGEGG